MSNVSMTARMAPADWCRWAGSLMSEYGRYYSAYDDKVHQGVSYTGYSLWDTFRDQTRS
ncbi:hypothetical protein [Streptomyces sp. NPDC056194]|uniref:hypothetical protein n=1 Tax=unclassified Streptomyces TaxID=2593676 RepID=UPI0035D794E5